MGLVALLPGRGHAKLFALLDDAIGWPSTLTLVLERPADAADRRAVHRRRLRVAQGDGRGGAAKDAARIGAAGGDVAGRAYCESAGTELVWRGRTPKVATG